MVTRRTRFIGGLSALVGFILASMLAGVLVAAAVAPAMAVTGLAANKGVQAFQGLPDYLKIEPLDQRTTFYATQGGKQVPIATFYAQNRVDVGWNDISQFMKDATVATEDPRFYQEGGIDLIGTVRGALTSATGNDVQGGSSITQQYVKNVLVQRCDRLAPDADEAPKVKKKKQAEFEQCYQDAAGVTIPRKVQEMRYAIGLDKTYSKDEILLGYLNIVGFGGRVYGVEAAAKYYFGVSAKDLNLQQAATLAAILNNPNYLRIDDESIKPRKTSLDNTSANGFAAAKQRRDYVLQRMLVNHKITQKQYDDAVATKIEPHITPTPSGCTSAQQFNAGFFCNYVEHVLLQDPTFGKTADARQSLFKRGGLNVYTTLNLDLQANAQASLSNYIPPTDPDLDLGAADISMEVGTGRIVSMVENKAYDDTGSNDPGSTAVNYTTNRDYGGSAGFQTGSAFKAFDLAAWLESGHSLYESVNANVHTFPISSFHSSCSEIGGPPWPVANDESGEGGYMSVLNATAQSVNTAFAMMGTKTDLCAISNAAKGLLVDSASPESNPWQIVPSMILGVNYISPLDMARAYAGIANGGKVCTEVAIDKVVTSEGKELPVPKTTCTQGMPANIAQAVSWALTHVMTGGTATSANPRDGVPIMGKTGTTDDSLENWLVTSTTKVANAVWVGNVQGAVPLRSQRFQGIGGGDVKFAIAKPILAALNAAYGGAEFPPPEHDLLYGKYYSPPKPKNTTPPSAPNPPAPNPAAPNPGGGNPGGGNPGNGGGNPGNG
jgi:membrane peptidoglycan carboxypeptidase